MRRGSEKRVMRYKTGWHRAVGQANALGTKTPLRIYWINKFGGAFLIIMRVAEGLAMSVVEWFLRNKKYGKNIYKRSEPKDR